MTKINLVYQAVCPTAEPAKMLVDAIELGVDAIVIEAYASGSVPTKGKISVIPAIKAATKKKIPVFIVFGSQTGMPAFTEWSDYKERFLPGKYEPEVEAIKVGAIFIERDRSQYKEVVRGITRIFEKIDGYEKRVKAVRKHFNSDEFDEKIDEIRKKFF